MNRCILCIIYVLSCFIPIMGQVVYPESVQMPSLESQSLGTFSEIPADLHTGRINIDIPIYTIKYGDIEMPISISYHGGGIRVTDEAGSVGLGWTLNVGGVVSHIVRGMPDDLLDVSNKIYGYNRLKTPSSVLVNGLTGEGFLSFLDSVRNNNLETSPEPMLNGVVNTSLMSIFEQYGEMYDEGHFDASPDNYQFVVQNLSGSFAHIGNDIICQTNSSCRILPNRQGYEVHDNMGYCYQFQEKEYQIYPYTFWFLWETDPKLYSEDYYRHKYVSSWWLNSISSEGGDSIVLHYDEVRALHESPTMYSYFQRYSFTEKNVQYVISMDTNSIYERRDTTYHKILRSIETPLCKVIFSYQEPNAFLYQYPHLENISIYSQSNLQVPVESFTFHYSHQSNRAVLTKIVHKGKGEPAQTYRFTYDLRWGVEPDKKQRDHWGYYSPQSEGRFPLRCSSYGYPIACSGSAYTERFANDSTATNCILTSITYPSGLKAELTWEPHDFSSLSYIGERAHHEEDYNNVQSETFEQTYSSFLCGKEGAQKQTETINISQPTTLEIDMTHYYETAKDENSSYHPCVMEWNAVGSLTNRTYIEVLRDNISLGQFYVSDYADRKAILRLVNAGVYTVRLVNPTEMLRTDGGVCRDYWTSFNYSGLDEWPDGYVYLSLNQSVVNRSSSQARSVGGVRIKEIKYLSSNQSLLCKQFNYEKADGVTSSGVLAYPPRYYSYYPVYETKILINPGGASTIKTSGSNFLTLKSSGLPFSLNGGSHIEYTRVVEQCVSRDAQLNRVVHSYSCGDDRENSDVMDFDTHQLLAIPSSMIQLTSHSYMRGTEFQTESYTDEVLVREQDYEVLEDSNAVALCGGIYPFADYSRTGYVYNGSIKPYKNYGMIRYRIIPYNKRLKSDHRRGSRSGESTDWYSYNNNSYSDALNANMPILHKSVNSEGDTITEHYTYLTNSGKISSCITTLHSPESPNERVIDAYHMVYDSYHRPIEKWVANLTQSSPVTDWSNIDDLATDLIQSCRYYNNRVVQKTDHHSLMSTVTLWSYANSYPVAEIENATWEQVVECVGLENIQSFTNSLNPDFSILNSIKTTLCQSRMRTYQYSPLVGIVTATDENGLSTYFSYDDFGHLAEVYYFQNGQKIIIGHQDYHWPQP